MSVIRSSNFDSKNLTVNPKVNELNNGGQTVYMNYSGKRVRVQGPALPIPYDSGDYKDNKKYKVQFSFRDRGSNPKVAGFFDMMQAIDDFVIDQGVKNAGKWFKTPGASREMIKLFFSPSIKYSKDKETGNIKEEYPPTFAASIKQRNDVFDAEMYDSDKQLMEGVTPLEVLRRGAEVTPILDATGIWISDKKFGITWKLHQAVVNVAAEGSSNGCQVEDDDDLVVAKTTTSKKVSAAEEEDLMAAVLPAKSAPVAAESEEDDDDVEEDEVVAAPPVPVKKAAPAPAPAAAPKKVVKKVTKA
jgi:hypothetical protein